MILSFLTAATDSFDFDALQENALRVLAVLGVLTPVLIAYVVKTATGLAAARDQIAQLWAAHGRNDAKIHASALQQSAAPLSVPVALEAVAAPLVPVAIEKVAPEPEPTVSAS